MRVAFFAEGENEEHILTIEDMQVPMVGDTIWLNAIGRVGIEHLPERFHGHIRFSVVRRDFSLMVVNRYTNAAHAEILLRKEEVG
jgi:hypothetical protein